MNAGAATILAPADAGPALAPHPRPGGGSVREMTRREVDDFIRAHEWGMFCTLEDRQPYAVPVSYGFDGETLFVATGPGRKARNVSEHPLVCLTISDVHDGSRWRSVVVTGEASWIEEPLAAARALNALRRHQSRLPSPADLARMTRARIMRIVPIEISGRVRG